MSYVRPIILASAVLVAGVNVPALASHNHHNIVKKTSYKVEHEEVQTKSDNKIQVQANRNSVASKSTVGEWEQKVSVGGLVNIDYHYNRHGLANGNGFSANDNFNAIAFDKSVKASSALSVNNANLLVDGKINEHVNAHANVAYVQNPGDVSVDGGKFRVDEAFITLNGLGDAYLQAGRKFVAYGNYNPYPITRSLTQLLTQTKQEVLELGLNSNQNIHASVYGYNQDNALSSVKIGFGGEIGYKDSYKDTNYDINVDYLNDVRDTSYYSQISKNVHSIAAYNGTLTGSDRHVAGISSHVGLENGPFSLTGDYTSALKNVYAATNHTKQWAYGVEAGYKLNTMDLNSKLALGYQQSGNSSYLGLPRQRILASYNVDVAKNTTLGLQYAHNTEYKDTTQVSLKGVSSVANSGRHSDEIVVRAGVEI